MMRRVLFAALIFAAGAAFAQNLDPLRNVSGTAANAGEVQPWVTSQTASGWTFFHGLTAHVTHVSESGPDDPRSEVFSTNWIAAGLHRNFGDRGFALVRGRISLEPYTMQDDGYPQLMQYIPPDAGGPLVDVMRPSDLIGEAALHAGWRPSASSLLHLYAGFVGDPALGPAPFALRSSGADLAEAPFSYELQETFHDSTSVVTAGFATRWFSIEASTFHDAVTFGDHTEIDTGDMDSTSARLTFTPSPNFDVQLSRGKLAEDTANEREITSASVSYGNPFIAVTAMWTSRSNDLFADDQTAYGFEIALRGDRHTFTGRAEWVDRPFGFPVDITSLATEQTTHFAVGYIFDFISRERFRLGAGVNADYHTQSHELPEVYGHKPQAVFAFVRVRSGRM